MDKVRQITFFLLRVVSGLLFMQAGGVKILDWFWRDPRRVRRASGISHPNVDWRDA